MGRTVTDVLDERRKKASARLAEARARKAELEAKTAQLEYDRELEDREKEVASDDHAHVLQFDESVSSNTVKSAINRLSRWSRSNPGCDIEIVFQSPGGSVVAGMALFDFILSLRRKGHAVTTRARGYAASMAGILLQAGDHRVMERESYLLIHRGSANLGGSMGEIEDTVEWFKKIDKRVIDIFFHRSREAEKPLSKATIAKKIERKDWWLDSEEALRHGFCDVVE